MYKHVTCLVLLSGLLCFSYEVTAEEPQAGQDANKVETTDSNDEAGNVITNKIFDVWFSTKLRTQNAVETLILQGSIRLFGDGEHIYLKTVIEQVHPDELLTQDKLTLYGFLNTIFYKQVTKRGLLPTKQKKWIQLDANTKCHSIAGIWLECMSCYNMKAFTQEMVDREQGKTT